MPDMPMPAMPESDEPTPSQPPPSVYLNEKDLEKFGLHDCVPGESYSANIRFTVTGMDSPSTGEPSKRIEIDEMSDVSPAGAGMDGEASAVAAEVLGDEPLPEEEPAPEAPLGEEAPADEAPPEGEEEETAGVPYIRRKMKKPSKFPVDFKKLQKI